MDLALLDSDARRLGEPRFRAKQVWEWAARGAAGYEAMTDLPAALRAQLAGAGPVLDADARARGARRATARSRRCSTPTTAGRSRRC